MLVIRADYQVGMPQLGLAGLSENWLLKECGHQHWLASAKCLGEPQPSFYDKHGRAAYAAFTGLHAESLRLSELDENDHFAIETSLQASSVCRFISRHTVYDAEGKCLGIVTMSSALVTRGVAGDNHSVARVQLDALAGAEQTAQAEHSQSAGLKAHAGLKAKASEMAAESKALCRLGSSSLAGNFNTKVLSSWQDLLSTGAQAIQELAPFEVYPCPHSDFNGAGFLYFANFQQFVDRAEWQHERKFSRIWASAERQMFFRGNINPGDGLMLRWQAFHFGAEVLSHWLKVYRISDGQCIADVFTHKVPAMKKPLAQVS